MDWWPVPCCFCRRVMLSPSLLTCPRRYSISVSNFYPHLKGPPQIGHLTQTKWPVDLHIQSFPSLVSFLPEIPHSLLSISFSVHFVRKLHGDSCREKGRVVVGKGVKQWGGGSCHCDIYVAVVEGGMVVMGLWRASPNGSGLWTMDFDQIFGNKLRLPVTKVYMLLPKLE